MSKLASKAVLSTTFLETLEIVKENLKVHALHA